MARIPPKHEDGSYKWQCGKCGKAFVDQHKLITHEGKKKDCLLLRSERPQISYDCDTCDRKFSRKFTLERHKNMYCNKKAENVAPTVDLIELYNKQLDEVINEFTRKFKLEHNIGE